MAGTAVAALDKAIEQRVIAPRRDGRRTLVGPADVATLKTLSLVPWPLAVSLRIRIGEWIRSGEAEAGAALDLSPVVRVVLSDEVTAAWAQAVEYARLRDTLVTTDPDVLAGTPVIRGTRVPVRTLAALVEGGESRAALREDYPHVPEEAYDFAVLWARANPPRGRPPGAKTTRGGPSSSR